MKIQDIAHILRASKEITGEAVFVLIGSQAVLVEFPEEGQIPDEMLRSKEIDIWPRDRPELADLIEGALGNGSTFEHHYGYHADGVGPDTAILPKEWNARAITLEGHPSLNGSRAICPEIHDLAASKIAAYREKDIEWVTAGIDHGLIRPEVLLERIDEIPDQDNFPPEKRGSVTSWIRNRMGGCDDYGPR